QGIRLVRGARHQAREGQFHALRAVALQDEAVERIESQDVLIESSARSDVRKHAALRGIRIDIVELLEVRRILEIAEGRQAMALIELLSLGVRCQRRAQGCGTKDQGLAPRQFRMVAHRTLRPSWYRAHPNTLAVEYRRIDQTKEAADRRKYRQRVCSPWGAGKSINVAPFSKCSTKTRPILRVQAAALSDETARLMKV